MNIIIELLEGIITRSTTAGKESTGTIAFMGGSYYIPLLDSSFKNGTHKNIRIEAVHSERYGTSAKSVISVGTPKS